MNTTIQDKAIQQAIKLLEAIHCQYAILTPAGEKLGGLEIAQQRLLRRHKVHNFTDTGYVATIKAMQVGDVQIFSAEGAPYTAEQFRSPIVAKLCACFGKGNYITTVKGNTIEALRVG